MKQNDEQLNANAALNFACSKGFKGMVEYLLTTEDIPVAAKEAGLVLACGNGQLEMAKLLVSNMEMTPAIQEYLKTPDNGNKLGNESIQELFNQKELNNIAGNSVSKLKR